MMAAQKREGCTGRGLGQNSSFSQPCIVQAVLGLKASSLSRPQVLGFTSMCYHALLRARFLRACTLQFAMIIVWYNYSIEYRRWYKIQNASLLVFVNKVFICMYSSSLSAGFELTDPPTSDCSGIAGVAHHGWLVDFNQATHVDWIPDTLLIPEFSLKSVCYQQSDELLSIKPVSNPIHQPFTHSFIYSFIHAFQTKQSLCLGVHTIVT